ncbi:hypothetical protein [Vibrio sp. 10N.239.312.D08]|uniref:hypothetical protein n=1 Tax=Vibrio sp. 10N.239.312.D08 TaxID=3229978 RepID=UPI00354EE64B
MHSVFKTYLSPNDDTSFENVMQAAFTLNQEDFLSNVSAVKDFATNCRVIDLKPKAERLFVFLMSEVAHQFLGKQMKQPATHSYMMASPSHMLISFSEEEGYRPITGGDTINHARANEKKLHIAYYCEGDVTEYQFTDLESYMSELTSFEEFFKEEF